MEDNYRQLDPYKTGATLGHFSASAADHVSECIARIETLKLKILGNMHINAFEREEFLAELNTLRAAYLHLCTLTTPSEQAELGSSPASERVRPDLALEGVLGNHPQIIQNLDRISRVAPSRLTVLLEGETGAGKELFARIIHLNSRRTIFVPVNCGALPAGVIESELFGHVKGAFTGATSDRRGRFEEAHGGTIFLDEVGELEPLAQVKLLRALDVGEIQRVGSDKVQKVDVRVIAATNKNLESMVEERKFREDLFFRLNVCQLMIPPLRERRDEIPLLLDFFIRHCCSDENIDTPMLDSRLYRFIVDQYDFPGNIRELKNLAQYIAHIYCGRPVVLEDLPQRYRDARERQISPSNGLASSNFKGARDHAERDLLIKSLIRHQGNVTAVGDECRLSRARLYQLLKKYDLKPSRYRGQKNREAD